MSVLLDADAFRKAIWGLRVQRATATLPATTQAPIYTIAGGRVILMSLLGEVTTIIQAQANALKVTANPTAGSDVDLCATVDVNALEVGGKLSLIPDFDATPFSVALGKQLAGAAPFGLGTRGIVLAAGTLDLVTAATNTGSVKWDLHYVPLDAGATVTAA